MCIFSTNPWQQTAGGKGRTGGCGFFSLIFYYLYRTTFRSLPDIILIIIKIHPFLHLGNITRQLEHIGANVNTNLTGGAVLFYPYFFYWHNLKFFGINNSSFHNEQQMDHLSRSLSLQNESLSGQFVLQQAR
jgi:hypothetical protein